MMPPHKNKKRAGRHAHPEWYVNNERVRPLTEYCDLVGKIIDRLKENGRVTISGKEVAPPSNCHSIVRFERMPHGEMSLKLELIWDGDGNDDGTESDDLSID